LPRTSSDGAGTARAITPVTSAVAREGWVDSAKGLGILLVVVGHCLGGMLAAELFSSSGPAGVAYFAIYTFHMPMFFFLSGLFVYRRLQADRDRYVKKSLVRLVWPYVLYCLIQTVAIQAVGPLANRPYEWGSISYLAILWTPVSQYWFLYVLALYTLVSYVVVPRFGVHALLVLAVFTLALGEVVDLRPNVFALASQFALMYALGVSFGRGGAAGRADASPLTVLAIALGALVVWAGLVQALRARGIDFGTVAALPAAVAGSVAWIALARLPLLARSVVLNELGRRSMPIYLLHVLFVAGTRIVLNKALGVTSPVLILVAILAAGLGGPLLVQNAAKRLRVASWVGLD
jgi:fucose 4-O-acetylase-like acetyltransferase